MKPDRQICTTSDGDAPPLSDEPSSATMRGQKTNPVRNRWQPRYQKSNAISWSFAPGNSPLCPDDSKVPLIVWIHGEDNQISMECVVSNQHRDTHWLHVIPNESFARTGAMTLRVVLEDICRVVRLLNDAYAISLQNVYLVGAATGAPMAIQLLLMQPDGFRGIAAFHLDVSTLPVSIGFDSRLRRLRAMIVTSIGDSSNVHESLAFGRLLHSAGIQMTTHVYLPQALTPTRMVLDLADWIRRDRVQCMNN